MILYFLQAGESGPIKIGITKNLENRIKQLEKEAPYEIRVRAIYPGNRDIEKMVHKKFRNLRLEKIRSREWFMPTEELLFWMENLIITPTKIFFDSEAKFIPTTGWEREHA